MKYIFYLIISLSAILIMTSCLSEDRASEKYIKSIYKSHYPAAVGVSPGGSFLILKDYDYKNFILKTYSLKLKKEKIINFDVGGQFGPAISNNEKQIAYFTDPEGRQNFQLFIYDLTSNQERKILTTRILNPKCYWSRNDRYIAFLTLDKQVAVIDLQNEDQLIFLSPSPILDRTEIAWSNTTQAIAFSSRNNPNTLSVFYADTRKLINISLEKNERVSVFTWLNKSEKLLTMYNKDQKYHLKQLDFTSYLEIPIMTDKEISEIFSSYDDRYIALSFNDGFRQQYQILDRNNIYSSNGSGRIIRVNNARNEIFIQNNDPIKSNIIRTDYQGSSEQIYNKVAKPKKIFSSKELLIKNNNRDIEALIWTSQGKKPPVILMVHGGPQVNYIKSWNAELHTFLENGIDIVYLNYGGSSGYGSVFMSQLEFAISDISQTINYLAKELEYKHIYIFGDSYGTNLALESYHVKSELLKGVFLRNIIRGATAKDQLPLKTLVFQGKNDYLLSPKDALIRLQETWQTDKNAWFVEIENEGHSFQRIDTWSRLLSMIINVINNPSTPLNKNDAG